jgi:hypothetical protein
MNNIIFLDIDGVLNTYSLIREFGLDYIDNGMVKILKYIVENTNARIVISSTWRLKHDDLMMVKSNLFLENLSYIDRTPFLPNDERCDEIENWLYKNIDNYDNFIILDDDPDASGEKFDKHFFQTDPEVGLTYEIAKKAIDFLNVDLQREC